MKKVLILDLDTPIFAAAAVSDERSILVTHTPTGKQKVFKNRTELKDRLKEKNTLEQLPDYSIEDKQSAQPIENACHTLKLMVKNIQEATDCNETLFFISGKGNFRDSIELPSRYKSNRDGMIRPLLLHDVKQFAINKFKPEICNGVEPDDAIIYTAYSLKNQGCFPIIASVDKDCLAYSGLNIYNQDKPEQGIIEIPKFGSLWLDDKGKVRGKGFLWYCFQVTNGDKIDGYVPYELSGARFGEKSAYNLLKDCTDEKHAIETVISKYQEWYPEPVTYIAWNGKEYTKNHSEIAAMYHKCARMMEDEFDDLDFLQFCNKYGVTL